MLLDQTQIERVLIICQRLQNSVGQLQIVNWLANFAQKDWNTALTILENLRYYSSTDIIYEFDESLKSILDTVGRDSILYVHGVGDLGKSGSTMLYYFKKTPTFNKYENKIHILTHLKKLKQQGLDHSRILLIDDMIGSGQSIVKFYTHNIKQQIVKDNLDIQIIILCVAYMDFSISLINEKISDAMIFGTKYLKAFASGSSVFGYRPKMLPIRNFSYRYGLDLFKLKDRETNQIISHPLGYNKSQSLVIFSHSVPNNTIPIIWSSYDEWTPLYPRNSSTKISQNKEFRNQTIVWLNYGYKLNIFKVEHPTESLYFKDINYKVLSLMRLKKRGSNDMIICQILGISINELNEAYKHGIEKGIFNQEFKLTRKGDVIYEEIKKKIQITKTENKTILQGPQGKRIYVPKIFLGKI